MSGTVAAVREGALLGRPGIAFSQYRAAGGTFDWDYATEAAGRALQRILTDSTESGFFWNVNLPDLSTEAAGCDVDLKEDSIGRCPDLVDCPVGRGHLPVEFVRNEGSLTYRGVYQERPRETGDDVDVCFGGNIAVTRLPIW